MKNLKIIFALCFLNFTFASVTSAQISKTDFNQTLNFCFEKLSKSVLEKPEGKYPIRTKGLGEWEYTDPSGWTSGFFPGCLWQLYKLKPDSAIFSAAKEITGGLADQQFNTYTHDVGFMMFNSFGNGYKLVKDDGYKKIILQSAKSLATRFNKKVGCIQSWDGEYQVIIDNMMNLELLFWASKNGGGKYLFDIAVNHAETTIKNHLRKDGTSFHVVVYDSSTGNIIKKKTHQGFADSSSWARGQAWGIYGFTVCYRETKDSVFLNTAIKMADYFIKHLPNDFIPYWDFKLPEDSDRKYRDASAAAIALSALLELRNYVADSKQYDEIINNILSSLVKNYLSTNTNSSGIILHSAYNVNSQNPYDWDASTIWGDYYFLESLIRYKAALL